MTRFAEKDAGRLVTPEEVEAASAEFAFLDQYRTPTEGDSDADRAAEPRRIVEPSRSPRLDGGAQPDPEGDSLAPRHRALQRPRGAEAPQVQQIDTRPLPPAMPTRPTDGDEAREVGG